MQVKIFFKSQNLNSVSKSLFFKKKCLKVWGIYAPEDIHMFIYRHHYISLQKIISRNRRDKYKLLEATGLV